jgi:6-phosphogluconolactonase
MTTVVYVSNAESGTVSVMHLDLSTGTLTTVQTVELGGMLMPVAISPDLRVLHVARRSEPLAVRSLRISAQDGTLSSLGEVPLPASMANIATDVTGRFLFSASYGGNLVAVSPIGTDGAVRRPQQVLPTEPKAHAMRVDPSNRFVFVPLLGADKVLQFRFDAASGRLTPNDPPAFVARPGSGPRHLAFHPNGHTLYLLHELDASIDVLEMDSERGTLKAVQTVSALPAGFSGNPWASDIHLTPDARHLYASERRSHTLAAFAVAADGTLAPQGSFATQAQPRGFAIDPSGRFLIAAGQASHRLGIHAIDPSSGSLSLQGEHTAGQDPNWVEVICL